MEMNFYRNFIKIFIQGKKCSFQLLTVVIFVFLNVSFVYGHLPGATIFQTPENENYIKRIFTTENGLPQNSVLSMVQTRDKYIWIATFGGLVRFDGIKFRTFTTGNTPELVDNRITCLYEDRHGVLWIGSEMGALTSYRNGVFTLIKQFSGSMTDKTIFPIYLDKNDILWFKGANHLNTYNPLTKEHRVISNQYFSKEDVDLENIIVRSFEEDSDGNLWIATDQGLIRQSNGEFTIFDKTQGLPDTYIQCVKRNSDNKLFVVTNSGAGFFQAGKFSPVEEKASVEIPFPTPENEQGVFFYLVNNKLYRFDGAEILSFELTDIVGPRSLLLDAENNVWIGGNFSMVQYTPRHVRVFGHNNNHGGFFPLYSIIEDRDGKVIIYGRKGIIVWKNGEFNLPNISTDKFSRHSAKIFTSEIPEMSLSIDKDGMVWIGGKTGLFKYENDSLIKLDTGDESINRNFFNTVLFSRDGEKIWSSSYNWGLQEFHNGKAELYTTADGLTDNSIAALTEASSGTLWIGTVSGISRFENDVFTNYTTINGLTNNNVRDIYEDSDGTIWIGTYGGGIIRYKDGKFIPITERNGLPEDVASRILTDDQNNFWVLGNRGIYSVSRDSLNDFTDGKAKRVYCRVYGIKDGMKTSEGNGGRQPAGWKTRDGKLWFPMIEGGVIIDPPKNKLPPPAIYVEDVVLGKKVFNQNQTVEINPDEGLLQINYTAIQFTHPEQVNFQYKLEGYDKDWRDSGTTRTATYQFLPSGDYTFRVKAATADGIWGEIKDDLKIHVKSGLILFRKDDGTYSYIVRFPFYQYWWLYAILIFLIVLIITVILRKQFKKVNQRQLAQQQLSRQLINAHESERRRIAAELHDSIGQSLAIIKNMAVSGTKLSNDRDSNEQFEKIVTQSSETISEVRDITYNLRPYLLDKLGLTEEIKSLLNKFALTDSVDIYSEIDNIDNLFSPEEEMSIYRIIQECFNNILKHSDASEAKLTIKKHIDTVFIKIQDDGRGFDLNNLENKEAGFGLMGLAERIQMIGGTYSVRSKVSQGTMILISLRIGRKAGKDK